MAANSLGLLLSMMELLWEEMLADPRGDLVAWMSPLVNPSFADGFSSAFFACSFCNANIGAECFFKTVCLSPVSTTANCFFYYLLFLFHFSFSFSLFAESFLLG
jgi:hypothetical protein